MRRIDFIFLRFVISTEGRNLKVVDFRKRKISPPQCGVEMTSLQDF